MNTINTLTVNGQSYALPDPRSVLDDSAASPDSTWSSQKLAAMDASASIVCGASGTEISLADASDRAPVGLKVYGKTEQFTTTGAQLIPYSYNATTNTNCGITFTDQGDHSYIVSGTATAIASIILGRPTLPAGTYTLSGSGSGTTVQINKSVDGVETALGVSKSGASATFTISEETTTIMYVIVHTNTTVSNVVVKPMLNLGSTALPFEPYTGGSPAPNPDYPQALESPGDIGSITVTVSGGTAEQTLTLSTPNGLPGIPVESGGNYTDETGQQWICDEIDWERGVYVKRISTVDMGDLSYNFHSEAIRFTTAIGTMMYDGVVAYPVLATCYRSQYNLGYGVSKSYAISTFYSYGTTVIIGDPRTTAPAELKELLAGETLMYVRKTPIETALTAEEIAAFAALHTNKPNTTVYNDASAHTELRYVADTKLYIDNKFNELAAALVNNT